MVIRRANLYVDKKKHINRCRYGIRAHEAPTDPIRRWKKSVLKMNIKKSVDGAL
ncbi:hypothetical protein RGU70_06615 [Herbaspirillum sp. RTI4]|uniref:hypothetical protein n=1 Tax=Herbaspirillum sp. RTI4 TaxID=3048640 RepID=UPI002AB4FC47|nr:hypothetical protein [Herbaspirillum sp. RTI4]MDY7577987.1 hypothetical protein [Herbaspirillum sp. RTI4]MEA9982083.1 hypothetical protein [Herbaspirillum sp. RTI4]